jgi:hypothetical protein
LPRTLRHGKNPGWQPIAVYLHGSCLFQIRFEADGIGIGQVVTALSLLHSYFLPWSNIFLPIGCRFLQMC